MKTTTRNQAVEITNEIITGMTFEKAKSICEPLETILENVNQFVWNTGVGGWYYNVETNTFCTDMIRNSVMLTYMNGLAKI